MSKRAHQINKGADQEIKVLMLTSVFPRWADDATPPFVQNLAELMVKKGVKVFVLAPHAKGAALREESQGIIVYRYPYAFPLSLQKLCYEGGMLVNLETRWWTRLLLPFFYLGQLIATLWLCWKLKPDIVHSHSLLPQGLTGALVARLFTCFHVTTSHGNDVFGLKTSGLMGSLKRYVLRSSDRITVNSNATKAAVQALEPTLDSAKTVLVPAVPNESDPDEELVESIRQRFPMKDRILFVGRLIEEKGVFDLLQALEVILPERPDLCAIFVGEGVARAELERRISLNSLQDRVHLVGWQPREAIASWMAAADLLVVPSHREAQGLVIVEAMAVGTPVVAARVGGIPDLVVDAETGVLVEPMDAVRLGRAIDEFLTDVSTRHEFVSSAHALYEARYSARSVGAQTYSLYNLLLEEEA